MFNAQLKSLKLTTTPNTPQCGIAVWWLPHENFFYALTRFFYKSFANQKILHATSQNRNNNIYNYENV